MFFLKLIMIFVMSLPLELSAKEKTIEISMEPICNSNVPITIRCSKSLGKGLKPEAKNTIEIPLGTVFAVSLPPRPKRDVVGDQNFNIYYCLEFNSEDYNSIVRIAKQDNGWKNNRILSEGESNSVLDLIDSLDDKEIRNWYCGEEKNGGYPDSQIITLRCTDQDRKAIQNERTGMALLVGSKIRINGMSSSKDIDCGEFSQSIAAEWPNMKKKPASKRAESATQGGREGSQ